MTETFHRIRGINPDTGNSEPAARFGVIQRAWCRMGMEEPRPIKRNPDRFQKARYWFTRAGYRLFIRAYQDEVRDRRVERKVVRRDRNGRPYISMECDPWDEIELVHYHRKARDIGEILYRDTLQVVAIPKKGN